MCPTLSGDDYFDDFGDISSRVEFQLNTLCNSYYYFISQLLFRQVCWSVGDLTFFFVTVSVLLYS